MISKGIKYLKSYTRIAILKFKYGKRLTIEHGGIKPVYIGPHCSIEVEKLGKIHFKQGVYLDSGCVVHALQGATIEIGEYTYLNRECKIYAMRKISIGKHCMFGSNVSVYDHEHDLSDGVYWGGEKYRCASVQIGDAVWCCTNVIITAGCEIGENIAIGANAVVTHSLAPDAVYGGVPAKYIKPITNLHARRTGTTRNETCGRIEAAERLMPLLGDQPE